MTVSIYPRNASIFPDSRSASDSAGFGCLSITVDNSSKPVKSRIATFDSLSVGFIINAFRSISISSNVSWNTDLNAVIIFNICSWEISVAPSHKTSDVPSAIRDRRVFLIVCGFNTV